MRLQTREWPWPRTSILMRAGQRDLQMKVQKFWLLVTFLLRDLTAVSRQLSRSSRSAFTFLFSPAVEVVRKLSSALEQRYCRTGMMSSTALSVSVLQSHLPRQATVLAATFWAAVLAAVLEVELRTSWHRDTNCRAM